MVVISVSSAQRTATARMIRRAANRSGTSKRIAARLGPSVGSLGSNGRGILSLVEPTIVAGRRQSESLLPDWLLSDIRSHSPSHIIPESNTLSMSDCLYEGTSSLRSTSTSSIVSSVPGSNGDALLNAQENMDPCSTPVINSHVKMINSLLNDGLKALFDPSGFEYRQGRRSGNDLSKCVSNRAADNIREVSSASWARALSHYQTSIVEGGSPIFSSEEAARIMNVFLTTSSSSSYSEEEILNGSDQKGPCDIPIFARWWALMTVERATASRITGGMSSLSHSQPPEEDLHSLIVGDTPAVCPWGKEYNTLVRMALSAEVSPLNLLTPSYQQSGALLPEVTNSYRVIVDRIFRPVQGSPSGAIHKKHEELPCNMALVAPMIACFTRSHMWRRALDFIHMERQVTASAYSKDAQEKMDACIAYGVEEAVTEVLAPAGIMSALTTSAITCATTSYFSQSASGRVITGHLNGDAVIKTLEMISERNISSVKGAKKGDPHHLSTVILRALRTHRWTSALILASELAAPTSPGKNGFVQSHGARIKAAMHTGGIPTFRILVSSAKGGTITKAAPQSSVEGNTKHLCASRPISIGMRYNATVGNCNSNSRSDCQDLSPNMSQYIGEADIPIVPFGASMNNIRQYNINSSTGRDSRGSIPIFHSSSLTSSSQSYNSIHSMSPNNKPTFNSIAGAVAAAHHGKVGLGASFKEATTEAKELCLRFLTGSGEAPAPMGACRLSPNSATILKELYCLYCAYEETIPRDQFYNSPEESDDIIAAIATVPGEQTTPRIIACAFRIAVERCRAARGKSSLRYVMYYEVEAKRYLRRLVEAWGQSVVPISALNHFTKHLLEISNCGSACGSNNDKQRVNFAEEATAFIRLYCPDRFTSVDARNSIFGASERPVPLASTQHNTLSASISDLEKVVQRDLQKGDWEHALRVIAEIRGTSRAVVQSPEEAMLLDSLMDVPHSDWELALQVF